ncbi:hypothetical protein FHS18_003981 [Paenibacillus phyllosphaerae]|uniref:Uncharacterized protein n=1 Tax=Paenibacillus phyllosphaerae TaxID=274593 RepID=A0A7W5FP63_9BACL|nr:CBO0543 family protein [Paenibacillus phyllosphaerae]MBB3111913.1 hypothetical protein [Paenibacillus phyllosphaerae]
MILASNLILLIATVWTRSYRSWRQFYATILFVSGVNLLYNFLCLKKLPWAFKPDILLTHRGGDLANTLLLLPCTVLLYLQYYPSGKKNQAIYYLAWIAFFTALETVWYGIGNIQYDHGWNLLWSVTFYFLMFFVIRIHHTHTGKALLFSLATVIALLALFRIPFWQ